MSSGIAVGQGRFEASAWRVESLLDGFVGYLREERGVSGRTVEAYVSDVRRFLARRGGRGVDELSAAEVCAAVLGELDGRSPASVRRYGCALRAFLRYCHVTGLIGSDLSAAVLPVSGRRRSLLPQGISAAQERGLLRACDRRRATGRRDYAVIVLMLRLGLRASEVAALTLDDMDWRAGLLTVHGKRACVDQLPLPVEVGEAIARYLRRGRPRTSVREVFVRVMPPRVGLTRHGVTNIVVGAARRAGLGTVRAHRLRHTAACDMLRAGASPAEIGQVLRHRSAGATATYARVDVERLRLVARPWPGGAGS
ncbi:MAG TPA: tyrosine-type recombinase/integrase [Kribbellaceae bacterium]|nr:tyrosine-type recombinase/integrase [Kribbellaceae bacterium]